jgi:hypothetical protein
MKKQILAILIVLALATAGCIGGGTPFGSKKGNTLGIQNVVNKQETFVFNTLPKTAKELTAMPEAAMTTPFMTAALTVAALSAYGESPADSVAMLNVLRGPQPLSARNAQQVRDSLRSKPYKPFSYFEGATPQNGYTPNTPYQITVAEQGTSYPEQGYAKLFIQSGGADSARPVTLRLKPSTGQWFLVEFSSMLLDIRTPDSQNPWR